jgi:hypothetical protein
MPARGQGAGSVTGRLRFHRDGDGIQGSFILRPELSGAAALPRLIGPSASGSGRLYLTLLLLL